MKKMVLVLLVSLLTQIGAKSQDAHYKIYDTRNGKTSTLDEIISAMEKSNVLFFGEEHNDSIGHYLEAVIFKKLAEKYPATALSMEMFHTDIQLVMNEYLQGVISEKNFIKEARAWNNYKDYKPMVEFAKTNKLAVIAANAATRYSNAVTMKGLETLNNLNTASRGILPPLPIDTATGAYHAKFIATLGGHSMGSMKIYQTQNLWDATMAWSIAGYLKKNQKTKVFHVNGRFHTDEKLGTYAKFAKYAPKATALTISCFSAKDFDSPDWKQYEKLGDFIIVTDPGVKRSY